MVERDELCGRTVGEFVLRERIGEGGFGAVYRCEQPLLGREAVVKVMHRRLRDDVVELHRFMREAQLASQLDHPYAAHVYAFGIEPEDGLFWIAMELVHGTSLDRWLTARGPLPIAVLIPLFDRIAEVVETAHEHGIIHRDLKPSNVMVIERAGRLLPKLLDFGIAKLTSTPAAAAATTIEEAPDALAAAPVDAPAAGDSTLEWIGQSPVEPRFVSLTRSGAVMGSPPYMSPEQWTSSGSVGPRSDLYALGVIAYEALTGRRPFVASTKLDYAERHRTAAVPSIGEQFPRELDRFFHRALAKRPEDRPGSALALAAELRVASGLAAAQVDPPRLDEGVRDGWLTDAPQPLAEAVAALDGARGVHQARDAMRDLVRGLVRYLLAIALAARSQVRDEHDHTELGELVHALRVRETSDATRVRLLRLLTRPFATRRSAHPVPELVDLAALIEQPGDEAFDRLLSLRTIADGGGSESAVRAQLVDLVPLLGRVLRACAFVLDYPLVVPRDGVAERWVGLRRQRRATAAVQRGPAIDGQPLLLDRAGCAVVPLWPMVQAVAPTAGAELELFLFDGRGRHGARLVAAPGEFEHHDPAVWEWLGTHVIGAVESGGQPGDDRPPYLGLAAFSRDDADRFVGREREIDACVNRLRRRAWQVIVGASGAGKSSFVHAGVVPALPASWRTVTLRPGASPIEALATRLAAAGIEAPALRTAGGVAPAEAAAQVAGRAGGTLVIVVDQLEEVFTLCAATAERDRFVALLAELAASDDGPVRVICTIRDDFLMQLEALVPTAALLSSALVLVGNPSREDLIRTVVEPAARAGYELFDPELARDMVDEVIDRPGALALLSFTAARLWEMRDRRFRQLTRNAYVAMGGVGGALGRHAEDMLETLRAEERRLAQAIFRQLVTAEGTRAVLRLDELRQRLGGGRVSAVIDKLVAARLLAVVDAEGAPQIELVHEALITAWPRLQSWVREDVEDARRRDQLRAAAKQWSDRGRPRGLLWRDEILVEIEQWRRRPERTLSDLEGAFVDASLGAAMRGRRLRGAVLAIAFITLAGTAAVMFQLHREATNLGALATQRLAKSYEERGQQALFAGDSDAALAFLSAAFNLGDDTPAARALIAGALEPLRAEVASLRGHSGPLWATSFSPDGGRLLTASSDGAVRIWNARDGRLLHELQGHAAGLIAAAWSPDGTQLVTCDRAGRVRLWLADGRLATTLSRSPAALRGVAFHPDGARIVAAGADGHVTVWDVRHARQLASWKSDVDALYVGLDGADRVVVAGMSGTVSLWSIEGQPIAELRDHRDPVWFARFSPAGDRIATASLDSTARIWTPGGGSLVLRGHAGRVTHVAWSRSGRYVATAGADRTARIWDAATGESHVILQDHRAQVNHVEFSPDDTQLITAAADGTARVWDATTGVQTATLSHSGFLYHAAIDASGKRLATASWNGTAKIWDLERQPRVAALVPPATKQASLRVAAGHALLIVDGEARLWQALDQPPRLFPHRPSIVTGDLAPDGRWFALGDIDGTVVVWDAGGGSSVASRVHDGPVLSLAIAPGGRRIASWGADRMIELRTVDGHRVARRELAHIQSLATAANLVLTYGPTGDRLIAFDRNRPEWTLLGADLEPIAHRGVQVNAAAFARDLRLVTGGSDGVVRVWGPTGEPAIALPPARAAIAAVAWSPSSPRLVVGTMDGTLQLWNTLTWSLIVEHRAHDSLIRALAFDAGGGRVATAGVDHVVKLWDVATLTELGSLPSDDEVASIDIDRSGRLFEFGNTTYHTNIWQLPEPYRGTAAELARLVECRGSKVVIDGALVAAEPRGDDRATESDNCYRSR